MRILHVSDTHLGVDRWFRGAPGGWRRSDDHLAALRLAVAPALRGEVDVVLHTGDLFDRSRPPARAIAEANALLAEVARAVPLVVMPGNHDRRGLRAHLAGFDAHVVDRPAALRVAGLRLGVVPWIAMADHWADAAREVCRDGVDLLLAHQAFDGARVPGFTFRVGMQPDTVGAAHVPAGVSTILCGHIHPRQALRVGDALVVHPGSTERTAFSERFEAKGVVRWEEGRWRFEDLPARPMHVARTVGELDGVGPGALVRLEGEARGDDGLRVALERGAYVAPWAEPTRQVGLFG